MYNSMNITTIYVSQKDGDVRNLGINKHSDDIRTGPVNSIERALEIVAEMRSFGFMQPITIRVTDEEYFISKPIVIDERMSEVTIEPDSKTSLIGAVKIDNFSDDTFNGAACKSCTIDNIGSFSDFYVNGKRARLPRYPKNSTLSPESVENEATENHPFEYFDTSKWFIARDEDFQKIKSFKNITNCIISFNHFWVDEHTPIESIDESSRKITMKYLPRFSVASNHPDARMNYYIENVGEMFGEKNDWYFDEENKKLYYIPEDDNFSYGYAPITDKIFIIHGTAENKAENVIIRNFEIAYTKGEFASNGRKSRYTHPNKDDGFAAGAQQSVSDGHAGIEYKYAKNCMMENCTVRCMGVHSIRIDSGCSHIKIYGNTITQGGAGGIVIGGGDIDSETCEHTHSIHVKNNSILHCGRRYLCGCGILIMHSFDNIISHNEIYDLYYTGISCGWVWGYAESISKNNLIEKNHIHCIGQGVLSDMGGIYLLGKQPGTVVRSNLIHDVKCLRYGGWGLYSDEGTSRVVYEKNICYNISENGYDQHYGGMNIVRNNIFVNTGHAPAYLSRPEMHMSAIFERNIFVAHSTPIFKVGYTPEKANGAHQLFSSHNLMFDTENSEPTAIVLGADSKPYSLSEMKNAFGNESGSIIADPKFNDPDNHDYTLKEDSPAFALGFEAIDMSDVGPIK